MGEGGCGVNWKGGLGAMRPYGGGSHVHVRIHRPAHHAQASLTVCGPATSWEIDGETMETVTDFSWAPKSLQIVTAAMKLKDACSL